MNRRTLEEQTVDLFREVLSDPGHNISEESYDYFVRWFAEDVKEIFKQNK